MLVLAEVKLSNRSFTEQEPTVTIESVDITQLGESYVAIEGQVFLKTILPIPQCSILFKIECLNSNIRYAQGDIKYATGRIKDLHKDLDEGKCKPEWIVEYEAEYKANIEKSEVILKENIDELEMYKQFVITK